MSKNEGKKWVVVVGRMLLAYALVFAQGAWAGQSQATKDKAASPQKAAQQAKEKQPVLATTPVAESKQAQGEESESAVAEEKPSGDGRHEGIKVHGHWTIDVRNPDGNLVTHREFENSLGSNGSSVLAYLLKCSALGGGGCNSQEWQVELDGSPSPCLRGGVPFPCVLNAGNGQLPPPGVPFITLSIQGNTFQFSGITFAQVNGAISIVRTKVFDLVTTQTTIFTETAASSTNLNFSAPIPAQAGQTIGVTVIISFS